MAGDKKKNKKSLEDYPEELVLGRESMEASFVFSLWREPDLYGDYLTLNQSGDETLKTYDGIFFFMVGLQLYKQGFKSFDNVSLYSFLEGKEAIKNHFEEYGGYSTCLELMSLVDPENVDAYYDAISKQNLLMTLHDKGFNVMQEYSKLKQMNTQQVYDYYDYILNAASIKTVNDIQLEELTIDDKFIQDCDAGVEQGLSYAEYCPILNYLTLGVPLGEMFMIGGSSGTGKSSFVFETMIIPMVERGVKCIVISNEQRAKDFRHLLLEHILIQSFGYSGLSRKLIKLGHYTPDQHAMLKKAEAYYQEHYRGLYFCKLFDNDISKIRKIVKKMARLGYQMFMYDTMKSDDQEITDGMMWQQLLLQSRRLFQVASRENIALVCTFQLALHSTNKRYLDATCLSTSKQVKEVFSEMVYMRRLWEDEFPDEKYDCRPYTLEKDPSGKYTNIRKNIKLDPDKHYIVMFLDKTRNNEDKVQVLYEFDGRYNTWKELGMCTIVNNHE